jgi:hypothetical protein
VGKRRGRLNDGSVQSAGPPNLRDRAIYRAGGRGRSSVPWGALPLKPRQRPYLEGVCVSECFCLSASAMNQWTCCACAQVSAVGWGLLH